jgi:hypothetical protein
LRDRDRQPKRLIVNWQNTETTKDAKEIKTRLAKPGSDENLEKKNRAGNQPTSCRGARSARASLIPY